MTMLVPTRPAMTRPWTPFGDLENTLARIFRNDDEPEACALWSPAVDLHETKDGYILEADLPGLKKEDIQLTIEDDVVTLKGERKFEEKAEHQGYQRVERRYGSFRRSWRIPEGVIADKVSATFENGVLKAMLPKPEEAKPKQIEVKVS